MTTLDLIDEYIEQHAAKIRRKALAHIEAGGKLSDLCIVVCNVDGIGDSNGLVDTLSPFEITVRIDAERC